MSGIYIHIPFCSTKCRYCDFFSRTPTWQIKDDYVEALCKEIELRKDYLRTNKINTIYFGGGTPSLLKPTSLQKIFKAIFNIYEISKDNEITLEANPEDLTLEYLQNLKKHTPINRLSIGLQSFDEDELLLMNRRHTAKTSIKVIENAKKVGFTNITADLIYGLPNQTIEQWQSNLQKFFELQIPHLSAYNLTIEEGTVFGHWRKKGRISEIDEEISLQMFQNLITIAKDNDFQHYEISNFAKKDYIAKHNFSYWTGEKYLGLGASAHSFDAVSRQWNIANIQKYIDSIKKNIIPAEKEILTSKDKFNELIMTGLRTFLGININVLKNQYSEYYSQIKAKILDFSIKGLMIEKNGYFILTKKGKFVSDAIMSDLIVI